MLPSVYSRMKRLYYAPNRRTPSTRKRTSLPHKPISFLAVRLSSRSPNSPLTRIAISSLSSGEQALWAEQSGPENLDPIVWPRAAASAEVFWTGPGGDLSSALPRLHDVAFRLRQRGVKAIQLQPMWCALRAGKCNLDS